MKKYAVAHMNFFDNDLKIKIVEVEGGWKDALEKAFPPNDDKVYPVLESEDLDNAKDEAFNIDQLFDVVEI